MPFMRPIRIPGNLRPVAYEREKYDLTLAALPEARYASALEVGCSIGVLTHDLAHALRSSFGDRRGGGAAF